MISQLVVMKENIIKGIMTELLETKDRKSAFDVFLEGEQIDLRSLTGSGEVDKIRNETYSKYQEAKNEYIGLLNDKNNIALFEKMKHLETIIAQSRSILGTVTKLSMINQKRGGSETSYVIARAPFFNPENVKAEIRVYLGKTEEMGKSIEELSRDPKFMDEAESLIVKAMKEVLTKTKVEAAIKKSVSVSNLVSSFGENVEGDEQVGQVLKKEDPRKSPFRPGAGTNPKPKHYGIIVPKKK